MSDKEEALRLGRYLARAVDHGLAHQTRDPKSPPTDGELAVMIIFRELDELGLTLVRRK